MKITTEFIKLDSFLKAVNWVDSGGMAKTVIRDGIVYVNDTPETRRGRKLYPGDTVEMMGMRETVERE
ncbi:MAG: RNA-binding S4 domain-containing protein [Peptoniphilus sp.]|nr:RNA-binding S4 domain-containing protein [Peptoniphilus sp.]MDD7363535.1 RNA-binding S4 domain-containing protein [Bacillota bacterium]MDY6044762.1 RNA-binding S4 domain-containing protein [Peptoniphilus sp.]